MLWPVVMSLLASIKTPAEAMASPPTYLPHALSLDNYLKVYNYQAGLPTYLFNSLSVAFLTIVFCLALAVPAATAWRASPFPARNSCSSSLLLGLMIPYQALLTPLYLMFSKIGLTNTPGWPGAGPHHRPAPLQRLPACATASRRCPRRSRRRRSSTAATAGRRCWRVFLPLVKAGIVTVILFAFIASWNEFLGALIFMSRENNFTVPIMLVSVRAGRHGRGRLGRAAGRRHHRHHPLRRSSTCSCRSTTSPASSAAR